MKKKNYKFGEELFNETLYSLLIDRDLLTQTKYLFFKKFTFNRKTTISQSFYYI